MNTGWARPGLGREVRDALWALELSGEVGIHPFVRLFSTYLLSNSSVPDVILGTLPK